MTDHRIMSGRNPNPEQRPYLHGAEALLQVTERSLSLARAHAHQGQNPWAVRRIDDARQEVHLAIQELVASLTTYDPNDPKDQLVAA